MFMFYLIIILLLSAFSVSTESDKFGFVNSNVQYQTNSKMEQPETKFITIRAYYTSNGEDFDGRTSGFVGDTIGGSGDRSCHSTSTDTYADHEVVMGANDVLEGIRFWVRDTDTDDDLMVAVYETCLPEFSAGDMQTKLHMLEPMTTSVGNYSRYVWVNESYKNRYAECKMMVRVRFANSATSCNDIAVGLQKFRAYIRVNDLIFANDFE